MPHLFYLVNIDKHIHFTSNQRQLPQGITSRRLNIVTNSVKPLLFQLFSLKNNINFVAIIAGSECLEIYRLTKSGQKISCLEESIIYPTKFISSASYLFVSLIIFN